MLFLLNFSYGETTEDEPQTKDIYWDERNLHVTSLFCC
jgi:hypothetical protein